MKPAALIAFVVGVCALQWQASLPDAAIIALIASTGLALLAPKLFRRSLGWPGRVAALIGMSCLGFAYAAGHASWRMAAELAFDDEGRDISVVGVVASLPVRLERGVRFEFDVERVVASDIRIPSRVLLGWYSGSDAGGNSEVQPGEQWSFTVRLKRPHGTINPGGFDFETWMLQRKLRASGYVRAGRNAPPATRLNEMVWTPQNAIERARSNLRARLQSNLDGKRYGGVLLALVLGDQRAIRDADWTLFNRTGIGHLVSISGLHITMIASLIGLGVGALWRRSPRLLARAAAQTAAVIAGLVAAFLYALLAGWGVPAQRTVVMLATVAVAWLFRSRVSAATSLALAAAVVCLIDPWAVLAPGFWLSYGAVAAILWVVQGRPTYSARAGVRPILKAAVRVQIAVTLALVPATVLLFHQLSIVSPLANAAAIPTVSWAVTPLALIGAALATFPAPISLLAEPVLSAADAIFAILVTLLGWGASFEWANVPVATPPLALVALAGAGVFWLLAPPGWPCRAVGAAAILPMFVWPATRPIDNEVWVTALDVGQGSALLVETRTQAWLYDAGPRYSADTDAGERLILPYLRHRGIGSLDGLIVSHLDNDHSGGAASVLRGIPVRRVISSIASAHPVLNARADVERCVAGMQWNTGVLNFAVLHPTASDYETKRPTNSMSCVVLITSGATSLLLTGDVPLSDETAIIGREPKLRAKWMSVPHHGSRSSSSAQLLDTLSPGFAVAQAGYRNRFRHPDPDIVARYRIRGIPFFRTDHAGALQWRFASDGSITVAASRQTQARYWHNRPMIEARLSSSSTENPETGAPGNDAIPGPPEPYAGR